MHRRSDRLSVIELLPPLSILHSSKMTSRSDTTDTKSSKGSSSPVTAVDNDGSPERRANADSPKPQTKGTKGAKKPTQVSSTGPLKLISDLITQGKAKRIVVLAGAGISTSAGIPDFRSPDTGLYANLAKLKLPYPEAVFDISFFKKNPKPFWTLAKELYPGKHYPTPTHYFLSLLHSHSNLSTVFTQNIDTLESQTTLPRSKVIEAHGSFATSHCLTCRKSASSEYVLKSGVRSGEVVKCKCGGLIKPDIVFFGEGLPKSFFDRLSDLKTCDLLIVIGTSLQVQPFAGLVDMVPRSTPRVLINREAVGPFQLVRSLRGSGGRDHVYLGDADQACRELADLLGWRDELEQAMKEGHNRLREEWGAVGSKSAESTAKDTAQELGDKLEAALKLDSKDDGA